MSVAKGYSSKLSILKLKVEALTILNKKKKKNLRGFFILRSTKKHRKAKYEFCF